MSVKGVLDVLLGCTAFFILLVSGVMLIKATVEISLWFGLFAPFYMAVAVIVIMGIANKVVSGHWLENEYRKENR